MYQVLFLFATVDKVECDSIEKDTSLTESILSTSPTHFHGMEKNPNHNVEKLLEGS